MKIRVIANARRLGGGEQSICTIMELLIKAGHEVHFHPTNVIGNAFPLPSEAHQGKKFADADETGCDVLFFYANNFVFKIPQFRDQWQRFFRGAARRVMCLNFDISHAALPWFRREWHRILFLNTTKEQQFPANGIQTASLAPAVDLGPFLEIQPDYSRLNLIRHCRNNKHCDDEVRITCSVRDMLPEAEFWFMATPPGIARKHPKHPRFHLYRAFAVPVPEFLKNGSLFWYRLAARMKDQGPRVVVEAMAAGLPCIVDDRDGAKDRVTHDTGWRCQSNEDYVQTVQMVSQDLSVLAQKGALARQRAINEFDPLHWVTAILNH
jgi:glycosyltransferase involved in cell wall biosynthesis